MKKLLLMLLTVGALTACNNTANAQLYTGTVSTADSLLTNVDTGFIYFNATQVPTATPFVISAYSLRRTGSPTGGIRLFGSIDGVYYTPVYAGNAIATTDTCAMATAAPTTTAAGAYLTGGYQWTINPGTTKQYRYYMVQFHQQAGSCTSAIFARLWKIK